MSAGGRAVGEIPQFGDEPAQLPRDVGAVQVAAHLVEPAEQYQRARRRPGTDPGGEVIVEMFRYRMNGLLGRLDEMSRHLDGSDAARRLDRLITELRDLADGPPAG